jgi:hypothetical protein
VQYTKECVYFTYTQLTNSVEQSPREANSHSASQKIPRLLWNLKVHCRIHKSLLLARLEPDESSPRLPALFLLNPF